MKKRIFKYLVLFCSALYIVAGCAKVMPLSGGDQDNEPPQYRSSKPDTFSTGFTGNTLTIRFNEYIALKDPTREIFISPPMNVAPEYTLNGQSVKIKFNDSLKKNITYIIHFGGALTDITEGNINKDFRFVFSTGNALDSGQIRGFLIDAFSGKPAVGFKVMLYETSVSDSFPLKEKPFYLAYSGTDGGFVFENIRMGTYRIFALKEENNTFFYDRPGEEISFIKSLVSTSDSIPLKMISFTENSGSFTLQKSKASSSVRSDFLFSGKADSIKIIPLFGFTDSTYYAYEMNPGNDSLILWHSPVSSDSFGVIISGRLKSDTLVIKTIRSTEVGKPGAGKKRVTAVTPFISFSAAGSLKANRFSPFFFTFSEPVSSFDIQKIQLLADSVPVPFGINPHPLFPRRMTLNFVTSSAKKWDLICDSAAFKNLSEKVNQKSVYTFGLRPEGEYADIRILLEDSLSNTPRIWQLLKQETVVAELFSSTEARSVIFKKTEPGTYRVRVIEDYNNNRKWDTGSFFEGRLPEKSLYLAQPIELKPGWDSEVIWKLYQETSFKKM